jgi:hypothetical protein
LAGSHARTRAEEEVDVIRYDLDSKDSHVVPLRVFVE